MKLLLIEKDDGAVCRSFKSSEMLNHVTGKQLPMFQTIIVTPTSGSSSPRTSVINQFITVLICTTLEESRHQNSFPEFCVIILNCEKKFLCVAVIKCSVFLFMCYTTDINLLECLMYSYSVLKLIKCRCTLPSGVIQVSCNVKALDIYSTDNWSN